MIDLTKNDIKFLLSQTKLQSKKLNLLLEEDLDLVIDSICQREITKKELNKISFPLLTKFIVFKVSKCKNYDFSEKQYIADAIINFFPIIAKKQEIKNSQKNQEEFLKYNLILFGFLENITDKELFKKIESNYRLAGKRELAQHLNDWITMIKDIKYEFFQTINK